MKKIIYYRSKDGKSLMEFLKGKSKEDVNFENNLLISNENTAVLKEFKELNIDEAIKEVYEY